MKVILSFAINFLSQSLYMRRDTHQTVIKLIASMSGRRKVIRPPSFQPVIYKTVFIVKNALSCTAKLVNFVD